MGKIKGHGWDFDPREDLSTGDPQLKHYTESLDGGNPFVKASRLASNNFSDAEIIQIVERT